jgi:hypothetical protein
MDPQPIMDHYACIDWSSLIAPLALSEVDFQNDYIVLTNLKGSWSQGLTELIGSEKNYTVVNKNCVNYAFFNCQQNPFYSNIDWLRPHQGASQPDMLVRLITEVNNLGILQSELNTASMELMHFNKFAGSANLEPFSFSQSSPYADLQESLRQKKLSLRYCLDIIKSNIVELSKLNWTAQGSLNSGHQLPYGHGIQLPNSISYFEHEPTLDGDRLVKKVLASGFRSSDVAEYPGQSAQVCKDFREMIQPAAGIAGKKGDYCLSCHRLVLSFQN